MEASRRWRGGRRDDSARTRRKILISTQDPRLWMAQLDKIPLLKAQLDQYIDPATGLINTELTGPMKPPYRRKRPFLRPTRPFEEAPPAPAE